MIMYLTRNECGTYYAPHDPYVWFDPVELAFQSERNAERARSLMLDADRRAAAPYLSVANKAFMDGVRESAEYAARKYVRQFEERAAPAIKDMIVSHAERLRPTLEASSDIEKNGVRFHFVIDRQDVVFSLRTGSKDERHTWI